MYADHVGCEFWRQQVQLGDIQTGIKYGTQLSHSLMHLNLISITLTETEKGKGPPLEFVGIPNIVKKELGKLIY